MKKSLVVALLSAPLMALAGPINLLSNGSFEATPQAAGSWSRQDSLPGWLVGSNQAELRNDVVGKASNGVNFLELDVDRNSQISQTVATVLGQWYELSFDYSNRAGVAVASNGLGWGVAGVSSLAPVLSYNGSADNQWSHYSYRFQATGSSSTVSFWAQGTNDSLGTSLDNVALSAVPEPQSWALFGLALAIAVAFSRRRRS
ncbi:DUF642 domain-containing protein [Pelomonas sp. SE-A7]|uniref:DUF642 domain-containing protein n=1 Tax=Pelomonas sp. SE-A7 TaxID=3054953 RepID=UPI00259C7BC9|nr:DUF642 domain-containing protein [Pelomonas sp. SE-A7]MDM4766261.1 DUF642 domain-containing protein [Pelomonas sp. SE-A7]